MKKIFKGKSSSTRIFGALILAVTALIGAPRPAAALLVNISGNALSGMPGRLDFQLLDGDLTVNNSATISALTTNGTLQSTDCSVGCAGGPPFIINDALGLGQFILDVVLGSVLSFDLALTNNFAGGDADLLVLNLLDPNSNFSLIDTNLDALAGPVPYQDALLVFNFSDQQFLLPSVSSPAIGVSTAAQVAEPNVSLLFGAGLMALAAIARRKTNGAASPLSVTNRK